MGEILHADFALHFRSRFAEPHDTELRFCALILEIDHITRLKLRAHTLQRGSAAADRAQTGWLRKGTRMRVYTPDFHGKFDRDTLLPAAIHAGSW